MRTRVDGVGSRRERRAGPEWADQRRSAPFE